MRVPSTVLLLLAAVLTRAASAADHDTVVDTTNFQRQVVADEGVWVVKFHSPRCGTCQEFAPVWGKFAGNVGTKARFGVVDIDTKDGMALAKQLSALEDGIPSVRVFKMSADSEGVLLWADWEIPKASFLVEQLQAEVGEQLSGGRYVKVGGGAGAGGDQGDL